MSKESRSKYLFKNTAIFAVGNMGTKLINFLMVPLYTYTLSTSEYGTINMLISICSVIIPLVMCNIGEAIRRYLLDKNADEYGIQAVEFTWFGIGVIVSFLIYVVFRFIPGYQDFALRVALLVLSNAFVCTCLDFLRGKEMLKLYTACGMFQTFLVAALNIFFLVKLHRGVAGYFTSYIIAYTACGIIAFIVGGQFKELKNIHFRKDLFIEMSKFSLTLVPNSILWWITNASDKLMVTYFISVSANGLYAISTKLPSVISIMNGILLQAWQYSAIKEADSKDKVDYNNRMLQLYMATVSVVGAGLLFINKPFMQIYVAPEYRSAWIYSPFLILSSMVATVNTFVGTSYYVEKDMKGNLKSAVVGAVVNIGLNLVLIPTIGVNGAAAATWISYVAVLIYRVKDTHKYLPLKVVTPFSIKLVVTLLCMLVFSYIPGIISQILLGIGWIAVLIITREYYISFIVKSKNMLMAKFRR